MESNKSGGFCEPCILYWLVRWIQSYRLAQIQPPTRHYAQSERPDGYSVSYVSFFFFLQEFCAWEERLDGAIRPRLPWHVVESADDVTPLREWLGSLLRRA